VAGVAAVEVEGSETFVDGLAEHDAHFERVRSAAQAAGRVLRYAGVLDMIRRESGASEKGSATGSDRDKQQQSPLCLQVCQLRSMSETRTRLSTAWPSTTRILSA
jgi:hypothetical protein